MTSTFGLVQEITFSKEVTNTILKLFYSTGETKDERRSSTSSYESTSSLDTDKPAGVEKWTPFVDQKSEEKAEENSSFWLNECLTATYSSLDYFLICKGLRWVLLRRKSSDEHTFDCITTKTVETKPAETDTCYISQCTIFGLGSTRQSELVDSLIVAIGTSQGNVIFYTENGKMLFEESFSAHSPILRLSMDYSEDGQLFSVVTEKDIFAVNAFSLHSTLLQSKAAIAKGERTAAQLSETIELEMTRFKIEDKGATIKDALFTGMQQPAAFDQYVRASLEDFNSTVDRAAPNYSTFFVHTDQMFATFSWFPEGEDSNLWGETVSKLASSFIPHFGIRKFLGIAQVTPRKSALSLSRHKTVNRSVLNDNREIVRMVKAPRPRPWIAVVDNLARVLIVDWKTRHVMRWFKGYRDAQVAFTTASHEGSTVIFLVIFAPRRFLLEVWPLMRGARIAAITVDPNGILLDGGTAAVICGKKELRQPSTAYFIDSEGSFFKINVPYHLAFLENNNREHDQLVLAKISPASETFDVDEFVNLYNSLHDPTSKRLAFFKIVSSCKGSDLKRLLTEVRKEDSLVNFEEGQRRSFEEVLKRVESVLSSYEVMEKAMKKRKELDEEAVDIPLSKDNQELVRRHLKVGDTPDPSYPPVECLICTVTWTAEHTNILEKNIPDVDILQICRIVFEPIFTKALDIDYFFDQIVPRLPFTEATIFSLFSHYILRGKEAIGAKFSAIVDFLEMVAKSDSFLLPQLEKSSVESPNISRGLLFSAAIWIVKMRLKTAQKNITKEAEEEEEHEWESFDPTLEHNDCTLLAMHAVWLLSGVRNGVTYSKMLTVGAGYFREQIASWVADRQLAFDDFHEAVESSETLKELFVLIPKVLDEDSLYADIGWELASYWFKSKLDNSILLKESVRYVEKIKNNRLRHGVAKLIWEKFLLDSVKAFSSFVERQGKVPKEREAKQYLQIHERHMELLLEVCCRILDVLWQSVRDMYVIVPPSIDHFLEIAFSHPSLCVSKVGTGRDSLVHIAVLQHAVNYHLVIHHLHLIKVYILVLRSSMRISPLKTVFCSIGQRAFFHPLDSHPLIPLEKVDDGTLECRHKFLSMIVEGGTEEDRKMAREMAGEWALTVDQIALVEALAHIRHGDDVQGAKEMSSVTSSQLGTKLAKLLAARILRLADSKKTVLTATHLRVLQDAAMDEQGRVEWSGDWLEGVSSLAGIMKSIALPPEHTALYVKIMSIATQYWGI